MAKEIIDEGVGIKEVGAAKRTESPIETYYKSISTSKKLTIEEAKQQGIALRTTKGGKVVPAVRQAGTFVPEDFATYDKFKDATPGAMGGTKDVIRFIQEIDGALSAERAVMEPGQAGPAVKYILRRYEDMTKMKIDWMDEQQVRLRDAFAEINRNEKLDILATRVLEATSRKGAYVKTEDFATNSRVRKITTDPKVVRYAQDARKMLEHWLKQQNNMRNLQGRSEVPYRQYYAPHQIRRANIWSEVLGYGREPKELLKITAPLPDYIKPNAPFNPRAMARETNRPNYIREMRLSVLMNDYITTAGKDIFNSAIIQNNKAFIQQLETLKMKNAARGVQDWTAEAFAGVKGAWDRTANAPPLIRRGMNIWRRGLVKSVFPLNFAWNTTIQTSSAILTNMRYGSVNCLTGMYDWFGNKELRHKIETEAFSAIIKRRRIGRISQQDINTGTSKAAALNRSKFDTMVDAANYVTETIERHLTGWSVASGLRWGKKKGFKDSALWNIGSDAGAKTQSMYNHENLPGMLRSETVKTAAPFNTFNFEMYNTMKEFAGRTGMPPHTFRQRVGWMLRFFAGASAVNIIVKQTTGREPWDVYTFFPFSNMTIKPIAAAFRGKEWELTSGRQLPAPAGAAYQFGRGMRDYMETGNTRRIRQWSIKYLPGLVGIPGGTQASRVVDGIIAIADEGVEDRKGRVLFSIWDTKDKIQAIFSGPWTTSGGKEYWRKREGGLTTAPPLFGILDIMEEEEKPKKKKPSF